jgi:hypothetical protein
VSDYGLHNRAIGVQSQAGAKDFSSNICIQTGSEAHPASCTMGTGGFFPRGKARPGRDADHSPYLVPRSRMSRGYTSSIPQAPPWRVAGLLCFSLLLLLTRQSSSGGIVSDYGLHNRAIGVRSQAGAKDFSSNICIQTGSEAHPASCTMGTGGSFPRGKARPGRDADHSPYLVPRSRMSRSYTSSIPQAPPWRLAGLLCFSLLLLLTRQPSLTQTPLLYHKEKLIVKFPAFW